MTWYRTALELKMEYKDMFVKSISMIYSNSCHILHISQSCGVIKIAFDARAIWKKMIKVLRNLFILSSWPFVLQYKQQNQFVPQKLFVWKEECGHHHFSKAILFNSCLNDKALGIPLFYSGQTYNIHSFPLFLIENMIRREHDFKNGPYSPTEVTQFWKNI